MGAIAWLVVPRSTGAFVVGTPTSVLPTITDPEADDVVRDPLRLDDVKTYLSNTARWLAD